MSAESLAEFELFVMLAVARLPEAYGAAIRREIEGRSGRSVSIGAVYATLARLGEKGLLTFGHSDPQPVQGGRARKFCFLTPAGLEALQVAMGRITRMSDGLDLANLPVEGT
ncbi:MAG TPA: helix-turn-helix transcriptional regulator [Longimicrobiales bacterium]|nr:helix-turn-helix transcriptional regulator [Longimicrobiales bacterium]